MKPTFLLTTTLLVTAAFLLPVYGCGDDPPEDATNVSAPDADRRLSRKGEACQVTNDCAPPLACQPLGGFGTMGICVTAEFKIAPTAKECVTLECLEPSDCCAAPLPQCPELEQRCSATDAGSIECQQYALYCKCDSTTVTCNQGKCVKPCTQDSECTSQLGAPKCAAGKCVRCTADADCGSGHSCIDDSCIAACSSDGECPGFNRCEQGKCIASGCKSDRECVAATRNVEATCGADGKCVQPCETDLECGNPKGYQFFSCIEKQCTYTGCDSDKDCLLLANGLADASVPPRVRYVCRDKSK